MSGFWNGRNTPAAPVTSRPTPSPTNTEISISAKKKGNYAVVIFQNCGPTIPADQLNTIFDKFNRLDEARTTNTGGAGLGLSIAKEIVNLHGGEITAQSQNELITFTVTLPLAD